MARFSLQREEGQGLAEYALILSLIAIVVIAVLLFMGGNIKTILSTIGAALYTSQRPIGWTGAHIARPASPGNRSVAIDVERRKPEIGDAPSPTEPLEARRIRAAIARRLFDALTPRADRRTLQVNGGRFCCRPEVTKEDKVWPSTP